MEMFQYLLASIVAYLGIVSGYIMIIFAAEEKKPGLSAFTLISRLLLLSSAICLALSQNKTIFAVLCATIALATFFAFRKAEVYIAYIWFSIAFFLLSSSQTWLTVICGIIFAYGLCAGTLLCDPKKPAQNIQKVLYLLLFIVAANILRIFL